MTDVATEELFRKDAYLDACDATVAGVVERDGCIALVLDRTVFYPEGGGQPGDTGTLKPHAGDHGLIVADTRKDDAGILHWLADGAAPVAIGSPVCAAIDWDRRHRLMRMHSAMHLLCSLIDGAVTGGQVGIDKSRLDFDLENTTLDKEALNRDINALVAGDAPLAARWIADDELDAQPDLVRTLSVKPPRGSGHVRLIEIEGIDLQPCGGTHVRTTGEIGPLRIGKIENKGRRNRRVNIHFAD